MNGHTLSNSSVVIDFDRTITFGSYSCPNGGKRLDMTSYSVFEKYSDMDPVFLEEVQSLYEKYIVIERDPNIDPLERAVLMLEWPMAVYKLYSEYITKDVLESALEEISTKLKVREGMKEFLEFFNDNGIPILIYSAGISNVISAIIAKNNLSDDILVHGNTLKFDTEGRFIIPHKANVLHVENKVWGSIPEDIKKEFQGRTHMIIMGDSMGDAQMGPEHMELYKIGFQLQANNDPKRFSEIFDDVIVSEECDRGHLKKVMDHIKKGI